MHFDRFCITKRLKNHGRFFCILNNSLEREETETTRVANLIVGYTSIN